MQTFSENSILEHSKEEENKEVDDEGLGDIRSIKVNGCIAYSTQPKWNVTNSFASYSMECREIRFGHRARIILSIRSPTFTPSRIGACPRASRSWSASVIAKK